MSRSFINCKLFSIVTSTSYGLSAIAELLVMNAVIVNFKAAGIGCHIVNMFFVVFFM